VIWINGTASKLSALPDSTSSGAKAINNTNQIVGFYGAGNEHGFLYTLGNASFTDLGVAPGQARSFAMDINNLGQIVGYCDVSNGPEVASIYQDGSMVDLNTLLPPSSGWQLERATGINDSGEIVGYGLLNGVTRGFIIVPEPATAGMWALAAILAIRTRRASCRGS
jgi:probable HAF family extracellular repeat protein